MLSFFKKVTDFKKWLITKKSYLTLNVFYVSICLVGLGYQVISISTNYFKYEVVSTIKIKLPGEESAKAMNLCVDLFEAINDLELIKFVEKKRDEALENYTRYFEEQQKKYSSRSPKPTTAPTTKVSKATVPSTKKGTNRPKKTKPPRTSRQPSVEVSTTSVPIITSPEEEDDSLLGNLFDEAILEYSERNRVKREISNKVTKNINRTFFEIIKGIQSSNRGERNNSLIIVHNEYMTVRDMFNVVSMGVTCGDNSVEDPYDCYSSKFIMNNEICIRTTPKDNTTRLVKKEVNFFGSDNVPLMVAQISFGHTNAKTYRFALNRIDKLPRNEIVQAPTYNFIDNRIFEVSAFTYNISRLPAPYIESCFDYKSWNFSDWNDAVASCVNELSKNDSQRLSTLKLLWDEEEYVDKSTNTFEHDFRLQKFNTSGVFIDRNETIKQNEFWNLCWTKYNRPDCNILNTMTKFIDNPKGSKPVKTQGTFLELRQIFSDDSSYTISSSPKFELVDFVSFLLGCLGTWLGFSFLGINPIPILFITTELNIPSIIPDKNRRKSLPHSIVFTTGKFVLMLHRKIEFERKRNENERKVIESKWKLYDMERMNVKRKLDSLEVDLERRFVERYRSLKREIALLSIHNMMNRGT